MLVDPDECAVDQDIFKIGILAEGFEDPLPDPLLRPAPEARVDAVPFAELARQITPGRTGSCDPQDRFNEQPIVRCSGAGITNLARQFWRNSFPLLLVQDRANQG